MTSVPKSIVKEVGMLAELGAIQVVRKSMANVDLVDELCDYPGAGWTMLYQHEEEWQALYWYKPRTDPDRNETLMKIRALSDPWARLGVIDECHSDGVWTIMVQCDYKRFSVNVKSPDAQRVEYMFSIKNEDVVIIKDTLQSEELNVKCQRHVQRQHEMQRIRRVDPELNENILQFFPRP
jgi:hypothetical protein